MKGYIKGETCNRNNCKGVIEEMERDGSCSCHINPPCSYCVEPSEYCPVCEWDACDEQHEHNKSVSSEIKYIPYDPKPIDDDGKLYDVIRYFDSMFEAVEAKDLTKSVAYETMRKTRDSKPRHYVSFSVVEAGTKR